MNQDSCLVQRKRIVSGNRIDREIKGKVEPAGSTLQNDHPNSDGWLPITNPEAPVQNRVASPERETGSLTRIFDGGQ